MDKTSQDQKSIFIKSFIENAKFDGISEVVASKTCSDMNIDANYYIIWFYDGLPSLVQEIENILDNEMLDLLQNCTETSITKKIRQALVYRIYGEGKNKLLLKQLSHYYLKNILKVNSKKIAWNTVNKIWLWAGDESTDWNYYSKRSILFTIYWISLMYYISNEDNDFTKTLSVIDKQMKFSQIFGKIKRKLNPENIPIIRMFIK